MADSTEIYGHCGWSGSAINTDRNKALMFIVRGVWFLLSKVFQAGISH